MTSELKAETNRQNSLKSTGPKTARGKAHARYNALTLGIYARGLLPVEDAKAYDMLARDVRTKFCPVGGLEEVIVGQIVQDLWRLIRLKRAEVAHFEKAQSDKRVEVANYMLNAERPVMKEEGGDPVRPITAALKEELARRMVIRIERADGGSILLEALASPSEGNSLAQIDSRRRAALRDLAYNYNLLNGMQADRLTLVPANE
jgi:hypothetical protein